MTRLEIDPATPRQVGALMGQWERLGYGRARQRPVRLWMTARMTGLPELDSTRDLRMGEAGALLAALRGYGSAADLLAEFRPAGMYCRPGPAIAAAGIVTPRQAASAKGRTRLLTQLITRYIAAELAARIQEAARDARKTPVQEPAA